MKDRLNVMDKERIKDSSDIKEAIYLLLKQMIMKRDFTPNERIDAFEIAEKLGVSRTPVRDALNMLGAEGFITTVPRQGIYVKGIYRDDLIELFQYREMVELYALEAGFDRLAPLVGQIARVVDNCEKLLQADNYDGKQMMDEDIKLHKWIVQSTRNKRIIDSYDKLNGHVQMARAYYLQDMDRINRAHAEHKDLLEALEEGNKEAAKRNMKLHLNNTLHNLLKMIDIYKVF